MTETSRAKTLLEPERQRYSIRRAIESLKDEISLEDYLRGQGVEVRRSRSRCIVHGGDNPHSFSINPEKQLWRCFACGHRGDLIDLCELTEKHADTWSAVVSLSMKFGVELPQRPERWHRFQDEKGRRRRMARDALAASYQRRYFRIYGSHLAYIEDDEERRKEARELFESLWPLAVSCAEWRVSR